MKRFLAVLTVWMLALSFSTPAFARNYSFETGSDSKVIFGKPTSTDQIVSPNPATENIRRNKDAAYLPPPYGVFSGDIPTDRSSLYHDNSAPNSGHTGATSGGLGGLASAISVRTNAVSTINAGVSAAEQGVSVSPLTDSDYGAILPSTSLYSEDIINTLPWHYDDGSIGTLSIPKLDLSVKVYEGETVDNMRKGVGHFEYTSAWDGTVGFAGHNRGAAAYFGGVKNLAIGDTLTYTTRYGTRDYEVISKEKISDTDYTSLGWTTENIAVLITCVENVPNMRWCVIAREK